MKSRGTGPVIVRMYVEADAADTLAVFTAAITTTASADYSPEQIRAWAQPGTRDLRSWGAAMSSRDTVVATIDGEVAGFSDARLDGYIDMMFVSPEYARRGVAKRLLAFVEARARSAGARELTSDASITARPFFERHGFSVTAEQHPVRDGVELTNYRMNKALDIRDA